jgi:DNA polymerase III sliding clamp (beta) subunit (PCNA family)
MIINKNDLLKALEAVKPGLTSKETIEQGTYFTFMENTVSTYNDKISIAHPIEGLDFEGAVKADELYGLLYKFKKDEVELAVFDDPELSVICGRAKAGLRFQTDIKNPVSNISEKGKWKKIPDGFLKALSFAMGCCGHEDARPILTCVHVNQEGFIEGTDSFRIARTMIESLPVKTFLIKAEDAAIIVRMEPVKIAEEKSFIHFKTEEGAVLSCRTFSEDTFIDPTPFLKVKGEKIRFPKRIKEMLEKAMVFSKRENPLNEEVEIKLQNGSFVISSESDFGWFEEEVPIKYEGKDIAFAITPYLLRDILDQTLSCTISDRLLKFEGDNWIYVTMIREPEKKKTKKKAFQDEGEYEDIKKAGFKGSKKDFKEYKETYTKKVKRTAPALNDDLPF